MKQAQGMVAAGLRRGAWLGRALLLPALAASIAATDAVHAEEANVPLSAASAALPAAQGEDMSPFIAPAAVITVTRAADLVGTPIRPILRGTRGVHAVSGLPLASAAISSRYGNRFHPLLGRWQQHSGVDMAAPAGTPVAATGAGSVVSAGWGGNYGYMVVIDHGGGVQTRYAHLSRMDVAAGQSVESGQRLGAVGSTGRSTGPHLHYEMRVNGRPVDPLD